MDALIVDKNQYATEQTDVIKTILTSRFFSPWKEASKYSKNEDKYRRSLQGEARLELYLTSTCNQHCEYCYLVKHPELYPAEYNKRSLVIANLRSLIDWIIKNEFYIPNIEIFSGEIWHSDYGLEVLEVLKDGVARGLQTDMILIPSNCSFILDPIQTQKIQRLINQFRKLNTCLCFSISIDGAYIEDFRPLNTSQEKGEEFYENLFLFAAHNNFYFHPMVASCNADKWIDNFKWFETKFQEYGLDIDTLMMLEVRNGDWTDESIAAYCKFLRFLLERIEQKGVNFFDYVFCYGDGENPHGYFPWALPESDTFPGCTVADSLTVRLGDMAICPCHRTAYNRFLYGHFIMEDGKIMGIEGHNPEMASRILLANNNLCAIGCDDCEINEVCLKGCFGSQFEIEKDPFIPIENVCKFFKAKYYFLVKYYLDKGVIDYLKGISPYSLNYTSAQKKLAFFERMKSYVGKD